jgi:SAM-dependent methyltransferase
MTLPTDDLYERTRQSWEDIWQQESSIADELQTLDEPHSREQFDVFTQYLSKDGVILEAGSGLGAALIRLREQGFNIVGLDYAENALRACHHYDPTLKLTVGDVHALPYADNALQGYLSFGVFEHFSHGMLPALRETYRVLAPGGILVMTIPYPNIVHLAVRWKRQLLGQSVLNDDDFYESTYTRRALEDNLRQAGFEILVTQPTAHSYTLWTIGGPFRATGYYHTSSLARNLGALLRRVLPWAFNFTTMMIARKPLHKDSA